jgi:hypothetical protein
MSANVVLDENEVILEAERYPGRPEYRVVTHKRTFDVASVADVQRLVLQVATRREEAGPTSG